VEKNGGFPPDAARGNFRRKFRVQSHPRASGRSSSSIFILGRWLPARSQSGLPISSNKHRFVSRWKVLIRESPFACNSASPRLASPRLASPRWRRLTVKIPPYSRKNKSTFVSTVCDLVPSTGVSTSLPADGWRNRMRSHTATSPPARFANIHQGYWVDPQSCVLCLCANVNPVFLAIQDKSLITREPYSTLMEMSNKHVPRLIGSRKHRFSLKSNSQPATRRASAFIHILVFHSFHFNGRKWNANRKRNSR